MLRRDTELHRVTSHALGCPAAFRAMPWMDRKTTSKGWQAYVEGAGDRGAVARRGRRTVGGRSGPERPWNWLTGTDASPDDLLLGESRKAEGPFEKVSPDDVRPSADLPDRDPRNGLTDEWRVVPGDRLVTFKPDALPESRRISAVRRNAADLSLVVNDPVTGEPVCVCSIESGPWGVVTFCWTSLSVWSLVSVPDGFRRRARAGCVCP